MSDVPTAISVLHKLLELVKSLEPERQLAYSDLRRAQWQRLLGRAYAQSNNWRVAEVHLEEALRLARFDMPDAKGTSRSAIFKQVRRQNDHWDKRHRILAHPYLEGEAAERAKIVCDVLQSLIETWVYLGYEERTTLALLLRVNFAEDFGENNCLRLGLGLGLSMAQLGHVFFVRGDRERAAEYIERAGSFFIYISLCVYCFYSSYFLNRLQSVLPLGPRCGSACTCT